MVIVVLKGTIKYNGKMYTEGEPIEKVSKEEAERLESLGVAKIVGDATEKQIKNPSTRKKKEDTTESET